MFVSKPVEIDSRNGIFVSSMPRDWEDANTIKELGIKRVVFLGSYYQNPSPLSIHERLQKLGIKVIVVPSFVDALANLQKNTLLHCIFGGSSQLLAMCYWVKKGLPPKEAFNRVKNCSEKAGVDCPPLHPAELQILRRFQTWKRPFTRAQMDFRLEQKKWKPRKTKR